MGNGTVIPNDRASLGGRPNGWLAPAQSTSKKQVKITLLDLRQRTAVQDCLLESATLNESAIMLLPMPRMKNSTGYAEFLHHIEKATRRAR